MDNAERSEWTRACLELLDAPVDWEPDVAAARTRLAAQVVLEARLPLRQRGVRRHLVAVAASVLLACFLFRAIPPASAFAQQAGVEGWHRVEQLWFWLTVGWRPPYLVKLGGLPVELHLARTGFLLPGLGARHEVVDAEEAEGRAGFIPRLPHSTGLAGPRLAVLDPISFGTTVRTADLQLALRKAGVMDEDVPKQWDGAQITLRISDTIIAEWSGVADGSGAVEWSDVTLAQCEPPAIEMPRGFDLAHFTSVNLFARSMRVGRMKRENARQLAQLTTTAPALLLAYRSEGFTGVREVTLRSGPAILIEHFAGGMQIDRITLLWSVPDRVYILSGAMRVPSLMTSLDLAGAVASAIDLANTIE